MTPNTTGPASSYMVPSVCAHGMAWSMPCAACNRPDVRPVWSVQPDLQLHRKLDRIIELLERVSEEGSRTR